MQGEGETLSVSEAAERLGVAEKTVRRWVKSGRLAATLRAGPYGPQYVIDVEAISTARQALAVATVERRADPRTLALAIVQALEPRDAALRTELADLRRQVAALTDLVAQRLAPASSARAAGAPQSRPDARETASPARWLRSPPRHPPPPGGGACGRAC